MPDAIMCSDASIHRFIGSTWPSGALGRPTPTVCPARLSIQYTDGLRMKVENSVSVDAKANPFA
eukprot:9687105-Alexandrium_andersonii.AAC.1